MEDPTDVDLHRVGTLAKVHKTVKMPNGNLVVFVEGLDRIHVVSLVSLKPFLRGRVEPVANLVGARDAELAALERNAREMFRDVVARSPQLSDDLQTVALNIEDPVRLADFIAANLPSLSTLLRQELLETADVRKRLESLSRELSKELEVLELRNKIQEQVQEQVNQSQREYLLREQMKAIQKELGESDDSQTEIEELRKKLDESGMSAEARKECDRELKRLQKMTPASAEYMVSRTYLEWMTALPWTKSSATPEIDIAKGQKILDEDHNDLEHVKQRHHDYLAFKKHQPGKKGPILVLPRASWGGQNFARKIHRPRPRDASLSDCRSAVWATKPRSAAIAARISGALPGQIVCKGYAARKPTILSSCSMKSTSSAATSAVILRRRSWKFSTPSRTRPSAITISMCLSISRRCCSSPPRTGSIPSLSRCATAWRSSNSPATPRSKKSTSPTNT